MSTVSRNWLYFGGAVTVALVLLGLLSHLSSGIAPLGPRFSPIVDYVVPSRQVVPALPGESVTVSFQLASSPDSLVVLDPSVECAPSVLGTPSHPLVTVSDMQVTFQAPSQDSVCRVGSSGHWTHGDGQESFYPSKGSAYVDVKSR